MKSPIITRFAPSPTGFFHVGSLRTALFNFLYTRHMGGTFLLRIEDTDKERSKPEYEQDILESLAWLGITFDNETEMYRQSEHADYHRELLKKLVDGGLAYVSDETKVEHETISKGAVTEGRRDSVIRFKNPNKVVTFSDMILGEISTNTTDLGDFVIAKDFDTPLYNFAVVCDDILMKITHVIRGQDHIANTPRQILIYEALGAVIPTFGHIPLILAEDKSKLSKRKHGESVSVRHYRDLGFLPEALVNFMALVGWNPGTEQEIFMPDDLVTAFDIAKVQKSSGVFNIQKLYWMNREHIKLLSPETQTSFIKNFLPKDFNIDEELLNKLAPMIIERINYFGEVAKMATDGEFGYYMTRPEIDFQKLSWKGEGNDQAKVHLQKAITLMQAMNPSDWNADSIKTVLWPYAEEVGKGNVLWPIRFALSGRDKSPDPFTLAGILGKNETIARLSEICSKL